jgi:hypothetical protein
LPRRYREILYALVAIAVVSAVYAVAYGQTGAFPAASGLVGHGIGVLGFVLMLMTETLYSIRKLMTDARWGSMAGWLRFHMVTGLVGPYMVLLHTTMRFRGIAGVATLLTVVVVISGLVGRYLYTAAPHSEGASETGSGVRAASQRGALASWHTVHIPLTWALFAAALVHAAAAMFYATLQR